MIGSLHVKFTDLEERNTSVSIEYIGSYEKGTKSYGISSCLLTIENI